MKKLLSTALSLSLLLSFFSITSNAQDIPIELNSPSAILADASGNIIFELNADETRAPASVTKIMTMLLAFEALDSGQISKDDIVTVSAKAESQGGTQVYLETGEQISVDDLLKSIAVLSANDASVAIGEYIAGSNDAFVAMMNQRALELGMTNTVFKNANGLTEDGHYTTSRDIMLMSVELLKHEDVYNYTTIWMDSIRDGEFELANTNKMLNTYDGLVGLKTGFTTDAMYCISATAIRNDEQFIAVLMGSPSSNERNEDAANMLDYAFANYSTYYPTIDQTLPDIYVENGQEDFLSLSLSETDAGYLISKHSNITYEFELPESIIAPILKGDKISEIIFFDGENELCKLDILAENDILTVDFKYVLKTFIKVFFLKDLQ